MDISGTDVNVCGVGSSATRGMIGTAAPAAYAGGNETRGTIGSAPTQTNAMSAVLYVVKNDAQNMSGMAVSV